MSTILVNDANQNSGSEAKPGEASPSLVSWIVERADEWEQHRHDNYDRRWDEYYRLWRGQWKPEDKSRQVERSRIVSPALQQAIEASVAEMEESVFHRERWFDVEDDVDDETPGDLPDVVDRTLEDFKRKGVNAAISEVILNGALYGTGIGKLVVEVDKERKPGKDLASTETNLRVGVSLVSVDPREFVIDPSATNLERASGMAHMYTVPLHDVLRKQANGTYRDGYIGQHDPDTEIEKLADRETTAKKLDQVEIIEYHGLVPKSMFDKEMTKKPSEANEDLAALSVLSEDDIKEISDDGADLVEAIVWIGNRNLLLRVSRNPFLMQDRSFVAFQYDTVPNKFWGRGVSEKGYNPQKALDAEMRARIDSLALSTYPMLLINGLLAPRNQDYQVRPGRNIVVNGNVGEALTPFKFPPPDPQSFKQTSELERMVTVATGSLDSAAPTGVSPRNETASGISMMLSAVLKRSKRTLRNIEGQLLGPLVNKVVWRMMQFDQTRYPSQDYKFKVVGALGAQAREFEIAQLTQLIQTQEQGTPGYYMVLKGILRNYNIEDKENLMDIIDKALEASMQPPQPPQPTFDEQVKMGKLDLDKKRFQFEQDQAVEDEDRKDLAVEAEAARDRGESIWNGSEAVLNIAKSQTERVKALGALVQNLASAQGTEGVDMQAILGQAELILEEAEQDAQNTPEIDSLRTSMARQNDEEVEPGVPQKQEGNINEPTGTGQIR